jgi:hypothetical protein
MFDPPNLRKGDTLTAEGENAGNQEIARVGRLTGGPGMIVRGGAAWIDTNKPFYIKLTSTANGSGGYAWKEVYGAPLGTWADSGRVGSASADPAYERNHDVGLAVDGKVYLADRNEQTGEVIFE